VTGIDRLIDASKTLEKLQTFVATDQLPVFLASFGDVEFKAAAEALRAHRRSRSQRREIEDALGHLRSAHVQAARLKRRWPGGDRRRGERVRYRYLLFESNFNGTWDEYIDAFSEVVPTRMRLIWGSSYGFPGPLPVEPFSPRPARGADLENPFERSPLRAGGRPHRAFVVR
jgi:hypothetical protein